MSYVDRKSVPVTTAVDGSATAYTDAPGQGIVWSIAYVPHASTPLDAGADITITEEATGKPILTITNLGTSLVEKYPRAATCDIAGAAITGGVDLIPFSGRMKFVVASGGNAKSGTFYVNII